MVDRGPWGVRLVLFTVLLSLVNAHFRFEEYEFNLRRTRWGAPPGQIPTSGPCVKCLLNGYLPSWTQAGYTIARPNFANSSNPQKFFFLPQRILISQVVGAQPSVDVAVAQTNNFIQQLIDSVTDAGTPVTVDVYTPSVSEGGDLFLTGVGPQYLGVAEGDITQVGFPYTKDLFNPSANLSSVPSRDGFSFARGSRGWRASFTYDSAPATITFPPLTAQSWDGRIVPLNGLTVGTKPSYYFYPIEDLRYDRRICATVSRSITCVCVCVCGPTTGVCMCVSDFTRHCDGGYSSSRMYLSFSV